MADLGGSSNAAIAFDFFVRKGLSDFQAAAIVGNLQQESRLNPKAVSPPDPTEPSRGIAQWQPPGWRALQAFAAQAGRDPWALDVQLDFLWHQLESESYLGLEQLRAATTIEDATVVFQNSFERCKPELCATSKRIEYARAALFAYPALKPPPPQKSSIWAATIGVLALAAVAGFGVYKAFTFLAPALRPRRAEPHPEPYPEPRPFRPSLPPTFSRRPGIDYYRDEL
jgi:hypothetical protein